MLRPSTKSELATFDQLDRQNHAVNFVARTGLKLHETYFDDPNIRYLSIENSMGELSGYFILVVEALNQSVEFRRVLIDHNNLGICQTAITEMEKYCKNNLKAKRIWLDVYQDNAIGKHIYEKFGYTKFKQQAEGERVLQFYEKTL